MGASDHDLQLRVNGQPVRQAVPAGLTLLDLLRDRLRLTGTHAGCDTGQCGACTVMLDGRAVKSCSMLALQAAGHEVTTVEGLAPRDGPPHPLQQAFAEAHGLQCGFCTPGMLMSAAALLAEKPDAGEADILDALEGNLCRCTGYVNIVAAVRQAARRMRQEAGRA